MPELPEIETITRGLSERVLGKRILKVLVNNPEVLHTGRTSFVRNLTGSHFSEARRRGKMIILATAREKDTGKYLLARLGMTGRLVYFGKEDALWGGKSFRDKDSFSHKHCHIVLVLEDNSALLFCDSRKFGYLEIVDEKGLAEKLSAFGPEPLEEDFTWQRLGEIVAGRKMNIKALLLNQRLIAGIGNIYADEVLFDARIRPTRPAGDLSIGEIKALHRSIRKILKKAVEKRGTTFSDYVDASGNEGGFQQHLKVYGRQGKDCIGCEGKVEKTVVAGRGTHFCPICQR